MKSHIASWAVSAVGVAACLFGAFAPQLTAAKDPPPQRWALLMGVNEYASLKSLRFAAADQRDLAAELKQRGFPEDQVTLLEDSARQSKYRPFKANILRELDLLLDPEQGLVRRGDLVVISFSGHGVSIGGKSYLCPVEATLAEPSSLLAVDDVYDRLAKSRAAMKLLLVDACRDDPEIEGRRSAGSARAASEFTGSLPRLPKGLLLLTSCGERQAAMEEPEFGHGVFMHYMLEGLRGKAADEDGDITLTGLYNYARGKTHKYVAHKFASFQTPALKGDLDGDFALARVERAIPERPADKPAPQPASEPAVPRTDVKPGEVITNSIGMKLVSIPAGEFMMGSPTGEEGRDSNEGPVHRVRITRPFYLGVYEVTQDEYQDVMGSNPSWFSSTGDGKEKVQGLDTRRSPVEQVSWNDAVEFCHKLSTRDGREYRLPTEAEWEYACRAGTRSRFHYGDELSAQDANIGYELKRTTAVGRHRPNAFGLYDMHGNVWEWCSDWYDKEFYAASPVDDPAGASGGSGRVIRGGSWYDTPQFCRSAFRYGDVPSLRFDFLGFRVACSPR